MVGFIGNEIGDCYTIYQNSKKGYGYDVYTIWVWGATFGNILVETDDDFRYLKAGE